VARVYDAPASLLFEVFSRPEHMLKCYGPREYPATRVEIDFRVGGQVLFALTGPDGKEGPPFGGVYLEIEPDRKIVYSNGFLGQEDKMTVTIRFDEVDGKTTVSVATLFPSAEMYDEHVGFGYAQGTGQSLDKLGDYLAELATAPC
jgi:uncharacterized protein YndB with AHSA1/START domain